MAEKIGWTYSVQALGGPSVTGSGLQILLIQPVTPSPDLSYKSGADTVVLDGPHVLIGSGAVNLLAVSVGKLTFATSPMSMPGSPYSQAATQRRPDPTPLPPTRLLTT